MYNKKHRRVLEFFGWLVLIFLSGCGEKNKTYYVEGTVLFEGVPLSKALVSFIPVEISPETVFASGMTNENGVFTLTVRPAGKEGGGTNPGNYIVTIERYKDEPSRTEKLPSGEAVPVFDLMIPSRYTSKDQSDLQAKVEKKDKNVFEFHLTK
ncbi:MAG: DUF4198 domain-containing protein [Planctomycetaceae bacterium]|jgi:hypothetical protein|nr:DUF4198 domain-containing protein [Planctomycetaceae bacterium]